MDKYTWVDLGSSFLPGELIASFLYAQLECADMINRRRFSSFERYLEAFSPFESSGRVRVPHWREDTTGNGHMFYLLMSDVDDRDGFINHMRERGVGTPFHYVPLHSAPGGQRFGLTAGPIDVTYRISDSLVRLPMFFDLGAQTEAVIDAAHEYLAR